MKGELQDSKVYIAFFKAYAQEYTMKCRQTKSTGIV